MDRKTSQAAITTIVKKHGGQAVLRGLATVYETIAQVQVQEKFHRESLRRARDLRDMAARWNAWEKKL